MLPIPEQKSNIKPLKFSFGAGLVHRLGAESVSDPVLSLVELVKNAYDDDATIVKITLKNLRTGTPRIIVEDNGNGMTFEKLENGWMKIATDSKIREPLSPVFKRHRLGQKGVGRFAVENLSKYTEVITYPKGETKGYSVFFDWSKYRNDMELTEIENNCTSFPKEGEVQGLKVILEDLRSKWFEDDVKRLLKFLSAITPPAESDPNFQIIVETDEFSQLKGVITSDFLNNAVYIFDANLLKNGDMTYRFTVPSKKIKKETTAKLDNFSCGPINLKLHFYYREKARLSSFGIKVDDIETFKEKLNDFGGIKIYRDGIRLSGFGNPDDDWTGLDNWSRNNPSIVPSRQQIIATVNISSADNPELTETTTRENLIKNPSFQDMLRFVHDSIGVFAQMRGEFEQKRQPENTKKGNAYVKKAREKISENKNRQALLDFAGRYPQVFYKELEDEINLCYTTSLPNACLMLSRKMVENLLYEIIEGKFPDKIFLRYIVAQGRAQDFSVLLNNTEQNIGQFDKEQQDLIEKMLQLIKPFRRNANSTAHRVMDYLMTLDELDKLRIPHIVEYELQLIKKISNGKKT